MERLELQKRFGQNCIGQVLRIIGEHTIIVSATKYDLHIGDEIIVYEQNDPLEDLDGNVLCHYEYAKDHLIVIDVNELYCVCKKTVVVEKKSPIYNTSPVIKTYPPLPLEHGSIEPFEIKNRKIAKGDPIKKF